ncbi:MAG TPA: protoporphyrinogen oxidase [Candidatus Obscuribacterales bacterium]
MENSDKRVVVIGGGISGLTAAFTLFNSGLHNLGYEVVLIEAQSVLGGAIRTQRGEHLIVDLGPESFSSQRPAVLNLAKQLGIESQVVSQQRQTTFISKQQRLHPIPDGLMSFNPDRILPFLSSRLFSPWGKVRMALEPLIVSRPIADDESLADFVRRRFGQEALDRLVDPLVGGIYGNDPELVSARATVPRLWDLEQNYGSVIMGLRHERKKNAGTNRPSESSMSSFEGGMSVLVEALSDCLRAHLRVIHQPVISLEQGQNGGRWDVYCRGGMRISTQGVIVATPAVEAGSLLLHLDRELASLLHSISYTAPMVVALLYEQSALRAPLKGSGFLIPKAERRFLRACSFSSNKFPNRLLPDKLLLRLSLETQLIPQLANLTDTEITLLVEHDLRQHLSLHAEATHSIVARHGPAIPQYAPRHKTLVEAIQRRVDNLPGLALVGNAYGGIGVADCVARATEEASRIAALLSEEMRSSASTRYSA